MENKKQLTKQEYLKPQFETNIVSVDVLLASGGSVDAFGSYNMGWFEEA